MTANAETLAWHYHSGQVDLIGEPYWEHLCRVATLVERAGGSSDQIEAAWLHDSLEDTKATPGALLANGVSGPVVGLVCVLTHNNNEPYVSYIERVKACPDAVLIKLCDLYDNLDPVRMSRVDPAKRLRLLKKYGGAIARLAA